MPRIPIANEYRTGEGGDRFPRIKMQNKGEKTRFTLFETVGGTVSVYSEYVHYLRAPKFQDGKLVKTEKDSTRNPGEKYEAVDYEFVGAEICLGDSDIMRENGGLDVRNCPACEASLKSGGDIRPPEARFAANVIVYATRGSNVDLKDPFGAEIKIWNFTGRQYDQILGIQNEIGPLRDHDLVLELEVVQYQKVAITFKTSPGWHQAPAGYIKTLVNTPGNKATDEQLRDSIGRDVPRSRMQEDVNHCVRLFTRMHNQEGGETPYEASGGASLQGGLDDLLADDPGKPAATPATGADPFGEFAAETTSNPSAEATKAQQAAHRDPFGDESQSPSPEAQAAEVQPALAAANPPKSFDFEDLLS